MSRHDPTLAVAHKVSVQRKQNRERLRNMAEQENTERKVHDLQVLVGDLMRLRRNSTTAELLVPHEAELCSSLAGLQFLCADLRETRRHQMRLEAAE